MHGVTFTLRCGADDRLSTEQSPMHDGVVLIAGTALKIQLVQCIILFTLT